MYCLGPPIESALSALPCGAIQNVLMERRPGCCVVGRGGGAWPQRPMRVHRAEKLAGPSSWMVGRTGNASGMLWKPLVLCYCTFVGFSRGLVPASDATRPC